MNYVKYVLHSMHPKQVVVMAYLPRVVKESICCFVEPLCNIFNKSLSTGVFPEALKVAKVVPLYKKNCKQNVDNDRPVVILPIFSKLLKK